MPSCVVVLEVVVGGVVVEVLVLVLGLLVGDGSSDVGWSGVFDWVADVVAAGDAEPGSLSSWVSR